MIEVDRVQVMESDAKTMKEPPLVAVEFGDGWISAATWHHLNKVDERGAPSQALIDVEFGDGWISSSVWQHLQRNPRTPTAR